MAIEIPNGVSMQTCEYVLAFTRDHEGDTPFMYNNWPEKHPDGSDVTIGVGLSIRREDAASDEIRNMFRMRGGGAIPSPQDMRDEFDRVDRTQRIGGNLWTAFRDPSPMEMTVEGILSALRKKMLE